jgi:hypothetical protein
LFIPSLRMTSYVSGCVLSKTGLEKVFAIAPQKRQTIYP